MAVSNSVISWSQIFLGSALDLGQFGIRTSGPFFPDSVSLSKVWQCLSENHSCRVLVVSSYFFPHKPQNSEKDETKGLAQCQARSGPCRTLVAIPAVTENTPQSTSAVSFLWDCSQKEKFPSIFTLLLGKQRILPVIFPVAPLWFC